METQSRIEPIVKSLALNTSCEKAFRHFTDNIHVWWPLRSHSIAGEEATTVKFEAKVGGRIYEIETSGKDREWGRVSVCEAPHRLVFFWVLENPADATEVEVCFESDGENGCMMTLTHRGWENRSDGANWRDKYHAGWDGVLQSYQTSL